MIKLNFLPEDVRRRAEMPSLYLFLMPPLVALLLSGILFWQNLSKIKATEKEIAAVQSELNKYKNISEEYARLQKVLDGLNQRIEFIATAREKQTFWLEAITTFASMLPPNTGLENLSIGPAGDISVRGTTERFTSVANFMRRLESSRFFRNVKVGSVSKSYDPQGQELGITTFDLSVQYIPKSLRESLKKENQSTGGERQS